VSICPTCGQSVPHESWRLYEKPTVNHCEVDAYGCLGEGLKKDELSECYGCGLPVCRGEECSKIMLYGPVLIARPLGWKGRHKRWVRVRLCANCIEERTEWGWVREVGSVVIKL
jgi:hypothetical protein